MLPSGRPRHRVAPSVLPFFLSTLGLLAIALWLAPTGVAQNRDLVVAPVEPGNRISLNGHHPVWATVQNDVGAIPGDVVLGHLEFVLARPPQLQQAFDQFLLDQLDPSSPDYHHWLTPAEIGLRFGASQHDLDAVTNWLQSQNLHVDSIANSRVRIAFSGPASAVANAFGAEMHYYQVDGEQRFSISAEPQIPTALGGVIKSISGLYTVDYHPASHMAAVQVPTRDFGAGLQSDVEPDFTSSSGAHFIFPSDFATIYGLPGGAINGAGQTIAVIGESRVDAQDITNFQSRAGLAPQAPTEIVPPAMDGGVDPGPAETSPPTSGMASQAQGEATLDVTRTTSIAPGATIDLVISSASSGGGIVTASEYVADTNPPFAQVMTISFSSCESGGQAEDNFWDSIFSQASGEGISVFVSSGDSGAAGCDAPFTTPTAPQSLSINSICASTYATCVGGTEFADANASQYWISPQPSGTNFESAIGYIPEGGWNEPENSNNQVQVAASGGGVSLYIATPSWQIGTGVPGTQGRYVPDVAFSASGHDAYFGCFAAFSAAASCVLQNGVFSFLAFSGTSAAAPDMAGVAALLNQKTGSAQGNLNPNLYRLAGTPSNGVFHDVTVASSAVSGCVVTTPSMCNNSTPSSSGLTGGLSGYLVGTGYDEVTGLGSINVANLLASWGLASTTTAVTTSLTPTLVGTSVTFTATVTSLTGGTPTGMVTFLDNGVSIGTGTLNSSAVATFATSGLAIGSHPITARYGGDTNFAPSTSATLTQVVNGKMTTTAVISSLNPSTGGQSVTFTATVTGTGGTPTSIVTFFDGATSLGVGSLNSSGVATFTTSSLVVGSHAITAQYGGDANFAPSTSATLTQVVNGKSSTTALASSLNPSVTGQSVTFTATVSGMGGTPTGTLTFLDGATSLGTGALNVSGIATFSTSALIVGSHSITAQYGGDTNFGGSTSAAITQVVNPKVATTTTLASSLNPEIGGQVVMFTATVGGGGGTPTGTVTFFSGAALLGTGTLSGGVATFATSPSSPLSVGSDLITASYGGDANFATSTSSAVTETVNVAGFASVAAQTVTAGQSLQINLTAFEAPNANLAFTLSCVGLPSKATCTTFSPNPVTPGPPPTGTVIQLTFGTASSELPASPSDRNPVPWRILGIFAALAALSAAGIMRLRQPPRRRLALGSCMAVIALAMILIGCGGSSTATSTYTGTPKGTSTFTVTGTSGATVISVPVSVTVQ